MYYDNKSRGYVPFCHCSGGSGLGVRFWEDLSEGGSSVRGDLEKFQLCGPREVNFSLNSLRSRKLYLEYVCHLLIILGSFH